jgi:hypothetical protein
MAPSLGAISMGPSSEKRYGIRGLAMGVSNEVKDVKLHGAKCLAGSICHRTGPRAMTTSILD